MTRIHILTALWQRPDITRICFESIKRLRDYKPGEYQIQCTAVASEGGRFAPMCKEYDIGYVHHGNRPLGHKWHVGLQKSLKHDFDFLMLLGSDDIASSSLLDLYRPYMEQNYVFGVQDMYIYSTARRQSLYFPGYDQMKMSIGAGRMIHRDVIDACGDKLWHFGVNRGLDGNSLRRIRAFGYDETVINAKGKAAVLDIKGGVNINRFGQFKGNLIENEAVFSYFGGKEIRMIRAL